MIGANKTRIDMLQHKVTQDYDFLETEMSDIRQIELEDALFEISLLKQELILAESRIDVWKDRYNNTIKKIEKYCIG